MSTIDSGAPVAGKTRWRRFGIAAGAGFGALAVLVYLAATGALALSFAFSGIPFTLSADSLTGNNFVQYAYPDSVSSDASAALEPGAAHLVGSQTNINNVMSAGGATYVSDTVSQFGRATIAGLAQQVCAPISPLPGGIRVTIAGAGNATQASNLVIQAPALAADTADFSNIIIGESVHDALIGQHFGANNDFTDPYKALNGAPIGNSFAQSADAVTLKKISQIGIGTEAGSFSIDQLRLYAEFVGSC